MKTKGRNICDTLKAIRKQIADANGIDYSPEECHFKGECKGTCPRCEQDVRDLEHELRIRQMAGKAIKVAGVALESPPSPHPPHHAPPRRDIIVLYQRKPSLFYFKNIRQTIPSSSKKKKH